MTRAELVAASSESALTAGSVDQQDAWYTAAKAAVERFCGQTFDQFVGQRILDGGDDKRLPLDRRLAELTGLELNAPGFFTSLAVTDVALTEDHDCLYVLPDATTGGSWATKVLREGQPAVFPLGSGTVAITGVWGWTDAEMPADLTNPVNVAILREMEDSAMAKAHGLSDTIRGAARLGLTTVVDGSLTATINRAPIVLSPESQQLLDGLVWNPPGFGA